MELLFLSREDEVLPAVLASKGFFLEAHDDLPFEKLVGKN
jgi:hypothetical protein